MTWTINLDDLSTGRHRVETNEGAVRIGKITKINWRSLQINGKTQMIPVSLEIDKDGTDFITFAVIMRIDRINAPNDTVRVGGTD